MDATIDPRTGWPTAFEAAARLGHAGKVFAVLITRERDGNAEVESVWVCKLVRTRGRKSGRGSQSKRRWREWWHPFAKVDDDKSGKVATDWFSYNEAKSRAERLKVPVYYASELPDNVHIVWNDPDDGHGQKTAAV